MRAAEIDAAVAARFKEIRPTLRERPGEYLYHGHRCHPTELGWRFRQNLSLKLKAKDSGIGWQGYNGILGMIRAGAHDEEIEATWHDAASAGWYYRYEKDYGHPEPEDDYDDRDDERDEEGEQHCHDDR